MFQEGELVYCKGVPRLIISFSIEYKDNNWRLLIDSSKRSLKTVLLHNGSKYASVPVAHSVHLKDCYENLNLILTKLSYQNDGRTICDDLKVISILLGQQCRCV